MAEIFESNSLHAQAYLIWRMGQLNKKHGLLDRLQAESRKFEYKWVKRLEGTYDPENVINRVHAPPFSERNSTNIVSSFFNLETHKLSMLVPEVKFFKVEEGGYTPFYFPIISDFDPLENLSQDIPAYAGGNTTVQSFNVQLIGTDPFTADKYLKANLTIKVDSLANIFIKKNGYARLADLFTISMPGSKTHANTGQRVKAGQLSRPIEVAAVLGYSFRDPEGVFTEAEKREIEKNVMSLRMNVTDHTINVQKDGTATVNIQYSARISAFEDNRHSFSVIGSPDDVVLESSIKVNSAISVEDITKGKEMKEKLANLKKLSKKQKKMRDKLLELQHVSSYLDNKGRFFTETTNKANLRLYYKPVKLGNTEDAETPAEGDASGANPAPQGTPEAETASKKQYKKALAKLQKLESEKKTFHFIIFGDMVESFCKQREKALTIAIEKIKKEGESKNTNTTSAEREEQIKEITKNLKKLKKMKILLPNVKLVYPKGPPRVFNMADIPISTDLYQKFVYKEILNSKGQTYSLNSFLASCANIILPEALGASFSSKAPFVLNNSGQIFASTTFTGDSVQGALGSSGIDIDSLRGPAHSSQTNPSDEDEYFLIYPEPEAETPTSGRGSESLDYKNNIYHFHLGKDRGIIKDISFQKFSVPFKQEALMTNQIGLYDELKMPYSANITMFGNLLFYPGCQIYIDPFSLGFGDPRDKNSAAADLGLGGYYMVLTVDISYTNSGIFETRLNTSFASWPSGGAVGQSASAGKEKRGVTFTYDGAAESSDQESTEAEPSYAADLTDPFIGLTLEPEDIKRFKRSMDIEESEGEGETSSQDEAASAPEEEVFLSLDSIRDAARERYRGTRHMRDE